MVLEKRKADSQGDIKSSKPKSTETVGSSPSLDNPPSRTKELIQEIRALNKQFSSWVEKQLSENPLELWIEGAEDYLNYATGIKEKYKEVVEAISSSPPSDVKNKVKTNETSTPEPTTPKPPTPKPSTPCVGYDAGGPWFLPGTGIKNSIPYPAKETTPDPWTAPTLFATPPKFNSSANSFMPSNSITPPPNSESLFYTPPGSTKPSNAMRTDEKSFQDLFCGGPSPIPSQSQSQTQKENQEHLLSLVESFRRDSNASTEVKSIPPEFKPSEKPSRNNLFKGRAKLFIKARDDGPKPWKDMGAGELYLRQTIQQVEEEEEGEGEDEENQKNEFKKPYLTIVNDVGKRMLNASLYSKMKVISKNKNLTMLLFSNHDGSSRGSKEPEFYLIRFSDKDDAEVLKKMVLKHAPKV